MKKPKDSKESKKNNNIAASNPFEDILGKDAAEAVLKYVESGGKKLALSTAESYFNLFLNGYSIDEIHAVNPAIPKEAVLLERVSGQWDERKNKILNDLRHSVQEKLTKAHLESASLVSDLVLVANKTLSQKIKEYFRTGDENILKKDILNINSVQQLCKLLEALQKIMAPGETSATSVNININNQIANVPNGNSSSAAALKLSELAHKIRSEKNEKK